MSNYDAMTDQWRNDFDMALVHHLQAFHAAWCRDMSGTSEAWKAVEQCDVPGGHNRESAWIYLFGSSGTGKTCCALSAAWRGRETAWLEDLYTPDADGAAQDVADNFKLFSAAALSVAIAECRTASAREELLQGLTDADAVLVDSLGTVPMTEACLAFIGELIDKARGRLIITSILPPDGLLKRLRFSPAAAGLVRRITDRFTGIAFA